MCVNDLLQSQTVSSAFHTFRVGTGIVWIQPKLVTQVLSRNARFVTRQWQLRGGLTLSAISEFSQASVSKQG